MKMICGTDFSVHANAAALAAAGLAGRMKGSLTLVHVLDLNLYADPSKDLLDHLCESRQKRLAVLADRARRRAAKVVTRVIAGSPAKKLAEMAAEGGARLLVLSAPRQNPFMPSLNGSVADQVAQSSSTPTFVIKEAEAFREWTYAKRPLRVLVGYDFSASAESALRWAASLREIAPCEITIAYVASPDRDPRIAYAPPMSPVYYPAGIKKFLENELEQACDAVFGSDQWRMCVKADWGRPDSQLLETALECKADLIVVGTSQQRGLARLGSVSRAVLHYAQTNVACVPEPGGGVQKGADCRKSKRLLTPIRFSGWRSGKKKKARRAGNRHVEIRRPEGKALNGNTKVHGG